MQTNRNVVKLVDWNPILGKKRVLTALPQHTLAEDRVPFPTISLISTRKKKNQTTFKC